MGDRMKTETAEAHSHFSVFVLDDSKAFAAVNLLFFRIDLPTIPGV